MNQDKLQEYQLLQLTIKLLSQASEETRKRVMEKLSNRSAEFVTDPIGIITECLKEVQKELDTLLSRGETMQQDNDTSKTMINDLERGKSFVEAMSSQARIQDEAIQQRRDERYQQMIDESEEVISPTSRIQN